jgi:hypothetical protein
LASFASIFGGSATGSIGLVQDVTEETLHDGPDDTMQCEDGLIWCETTMQCIDPTTVSCSTIKVVKGTHHMDAIVQGEKSAIIFHDSEAEGQHELKMKLEEERIAQERQLNELISKLPSGILVTFDGTDHYRLTDEVYESHKYSRRKF